MGGISQNTAMMMMLLQQQLARELRPRHSSWRPRHPRLEMHLLASSRRRPLTPMCVVTEMMRSSGDPGRGGGGAASTMMCSSLQAKAAVKSLTVKKHDAAVDEVED